MFPLKDNIPSKSFPYVTVFLLLLNVTVFIYQLSLGKMTGDFFLRFGVIPYQITYGIDIYPINDFPIILTLFTGMFVHGGFLHIFGNMLYLWIFGDNVENAMGHLGFLIFYLLCGLIAFYTQIYLHPGSKIPVIGASGAVSGVLGAYLLLFPYARISTIFTFVYFIKIVQVPAIFLLGLWIFIQFLYSILLTGEHTDKEQAMEQALNVANKIQTAISKSYRLHGFEHIITASIGITVYPDKNTTVTELLKQADTAMYRAKDDGRNTISFYNTELQKVADKRLLIEKELRYAIANDRRQLRRFQ